MITELTFDEIKYLKKNNRSVMVEYTTGYTEVTKIFNKTDTGYKITFSDNTIIKCARTHRLLIDNEWKVADDFVIEDYCTDKYGYKSKSIINIQPLEEQEWIDFSVANEFESYIQNNIIHHNSGKSLILGLIMYYQFSQKRKTLLIVPNVLLLQQMKQDLIDYFGECSFNGHIVTIGGDTSMNREEKEAVFADDSIIVSTWQSLYANPDLVQDVECIMVDECLAGDTKITMNDDSTKMIRDIIPGDKVKTINEITGGIEVKEVIRLHTNIPSEEMYELETENGIIQITGNHKVHTLTGWKRVDELTLNDEIIRL